MLKIEDLKEGEYYHSDYDNLVFIFDGLDKFNQIKYKVKCQIFNNKNYFIENDSFRRGGKIEKTLKLATKEQKHWLNECIKVNKFIPYEEAIKTFNQENNPPFKIGDKVYLEKHYKHETESQDYSTHIPLNKELKIKNIIFSSDIYGNKEKEWVVYVESCDLGHPACKFKLWNKEETMFRKGDYIIPLNTQEKFIIPEKWCIKVTDENKDVLTKWVALHNIDKDFFPIRGWVVDISQDKTCQKWWGNSKDNDFTEITFEQFKQYIFKQNSIFPVEKIENRIQELKQYPLTTEECISNNDIIEIGDEVEITKSYDKYKIGLKGILLENDENSIPYKVKTTEYGNIWCKDIKLVKKASQTTNYIHEKQVDSVSPQVNTDLLFIKKAKKAKEIEILPVQSPIFVKQKVSKKQLLILN